MVLLPFWRYMFGLSRISSVTPHTGAWKHLVPRMGEKASTCSAYREAEGGAGAGSCWRPQRRFKVTKESWAIWDNPENRKSS